MVIPEPKYIGGTSALLRKRRSTRYETIPKENFWDKFSKKKDNQHPFLLGCSCPLCEDRLYALLRRD